MPRFPRDVTQEQAVRAFVRAGGLEIAGGKGSHRRVQMPNGARLTLPRTLKVGLLRDMVEEAGISVEQFIELL